MKILITGAAGFIGHAFALRLLARGESVVGIDNLNDYYDPALKEARLTRLTQQPGFVFKRLDICDRAAMAELFAREKFDKVMHLAAQAGVRYSIQNPHAYIDANVNGFMNILEGARHANVKHLVFASSSSVYGLSTKLPFSEEDVTDHPVSLYAATKKANELMAHSYAHLFDMPVTGLRFFTVYGPWGRPDMALFLFTRAILADEPIRLFNEGRMIRDFTYIDDIVEGMVRVIDKTAEPDGAWSSVAPKSAISKAPYRLFNIGNNQRVELMRYVHALEDCLGKKAKIEMLPMQAGDVAATEADITHLERWIGFKPETNVEAGVANFVSWYRDFYKT